MRNEITQGKMKDNQWAAVRQYFVEAMEYGMEVHEYQPEDIKMTDNGIVVHSKYGPQQFAELMIDVGIYVMAELG